MLGRERDREFAEMELDQADLLAGEALIRSKPANVVIALTDHGLRRLPFDQLLQVTGFAGQEAIGGPLHLTTDRLLFKAHRVNRLTGAFSVSLPTIRELRDASRLLVRKLEVATGLQTCPFVVWGVPDLIRAIGVARAGLPAGEAARVRALAATRAAGGLVPSGYGDQLAANRFEILNAGMALTQNPLDLANLLNLAELLTPPEPTA
jgi:hypothetical protein